MLYVTYVDQQAGLKVLDVQVAVAVEVYPSLQHERASNMHGICGPLARHQNIPARQNLKSNRATIFLPFNERRASKGFVLLQGINFLLILRMLNTEFMGLTKGQPESQQNLILPGKKEPYIIQIQEILQVDFKTLRRLKSSVIFSISTDNFNLLYFCQK